MGKSECGMRNGKEWGSRNAEGGNENDLKAEVGMRKAENMENER